MRYLGRAFYVAVAAAIAHRINTTRQLAARYSKGVMAPSPSVPGPAIVPVSRYLRNGSLDVYQLDFCRHSYLSSRRMWRIGEPKRRSKDKSAGWGAYRSSLILKVWGRGISHKICEGVSREFQNKFAKRYGAHVCLDRVPSLYSCERVTCPVSSKPIARAAAGVRSISLPRTQGPRSLMRTVTHLP